MNENALHIRPFTDADKAAWNRFVSESEQATFFHRLEWRQIIKENFGHRTHYLIAERNGNLCGLLPLAQVKGPLGGRIFGHSLTSLPLAVYAGAIGSDDQVVKALNQAATQLGRDLKVDHVELRHQERLEPEWPCQDLYFTFRRALKPDHEANMLDIPRKQRAMVRKGINNGLTSVIEKDATRFFELYADNMQRHGTPPMSKKYFEALLKLFGDDCDVLLVLNKEGLPVSGTLSFYFREEVLPYYAGDLTSARELAANDFKYWELMRHAVDKGCNSFDFGRSKRDTGAFDFKKNWGFTPEPLFYEYQLFKSDSIPQNNPNNPKYQKVIELWRKLPRPVVNALGPHIVRYLG